MLPALLPVLLLVPLLGRLPPLHPPLLPWQAVKASEDLLHRERAVGC